MNKKTKIIATIGPSCDNSEVLLNMIKEGVYGFRINFSHSSHQDIFNRFSIIRKVFKISKRKEFIFGDIQGPKIRLGQIKSFKVNFEDKIFITSKDSKRDRFIFVDYPDFLKHINKGDRIFIDDGKVELLVEDVRNDHALCRVIMGGTIHPRKGVSVVNKKLPLPSLTEKDIQDLEFALNIGMNKFAISFVRSKKNVEDVRKYLYKIKKNDFFLISKIEDREGFENIDEIISVSDAVMVARGDLGVSVNRSVVPIIQKEIIDKCSRNKVPDIVATQMLETMTFNPYPTRAEVNDVAVAVIQGADYVMLSGETAIGRYPVLAVKEMKNIIDEVERYLKSKKIKF